jgi:cytochrome c-type biogenesis protein CcmH/NrfG
MHASAIVVVTLVAYCGSFDGDFVSDDIVAVRDNRLLTSLSPANVRAIFGRFDGPNYVPMKVLSLAVDRRVWGTGPTGYHVTNLILHLLCALLVYAILSRLGLAPPAACIAGMLWAVHPLQVESVAWISERKNVLSGAFFFAAFWLYLSFSERPHVASYVGFLALFVLALLSKMNTMVLPAVCLAYEATFRRRMRWRDVLAAVLPIGAGVLVGWYNLVGNPIHGDAWYGGSRIVTWLSSSVVLFRYLKHVFVPLDLQPRYDVPLRGSMLDPPVLLSLLALAGLVVVFAWMVRRGRREAFWMLWFGITLVPMLNVVVPFRSLMNDRYMYLSLLGPLALLAFPLADARRLVRRSAVIVAGVAVLACTLLTFRQVEIWSDALSMWKASAATLSMPGEDPVYQRPDRAVRVAFLEQALAADPSSGVLHHNLGELYYESGQLDDALAELNAAERLRPSDPVVLSDLGRLDILLRRPAEAEAALTRAIALRPYDFVHRWYLAQLYLFVTRDAEKARATLDAALPLQPDAAPALRREREALARLEAEGRAGTAR